MDDLKAEREKENKGREGWELKGDGDNWKHDRRVTHWSCRVSTLRRR